MMEASDDISKRAIQGYGSPDEFKKQQNMVNQNKYHPVTNPDGIINMALGINRLTTTTLHEYLLEKNIKIDREKHLEFRDPKQNNQLKRNVADYYNATWNGNEEMIQPEQIAIINGVVSCIDGLAFALFDPGDVIIMPTPIYTTIQQQLMLRARLEVKEWNTECQDSDGNVFYSLQADSLERCILKIQDEGHAVKGILLINPNNPTGEVYSKDVIESLLILCSRYKMHFIVDEVYAHPVLTPKEKFCSLLSIANLPDPKRTHMLFGLNKIFGLPGLRIAFVWTKNISLMKILEKLCDFKTPSSYSKDIASIILSDRKWLMEEFFPSNERLLRDNMNWVRSSFQKMGANVYPSELGVMLWVNFRPFLNPCTQEEEEKLFEEFFEAGVMMNPGFVMKTKTHGWFRANISIEAELLEEGLNRVSKVLQKRRPCSLL